MVGQNVYKEDEINFILDLLVEGVDGDEISRRYLATHNKVLTANQLRYVKNKYGKDPKYGTKMINTDMGRKRKRPARDAGHAPSPQKIVATNNNRVPNLAGEEHPPRTARPSAPMAVMTEPTRAQHRRSAAISATASAAPSAESAVPQSFRLPQTGSREGYLQYRESTRRPAQPQQQQQEAQNPLPMAMPDYRVMASAPMQGLPVYEQQTKNLSLYRPGPYSETFPFMPELLAPTAYDHAANNAMNAYYTPQQSRQSSFEPPQQRRQQTQAQEQDYLSLTGNYATQSHGYPEQNALTPSDSGSGNGTGPATVNTSSSQGFPYQHLHLFQPGQMARDPYAITDFQYQQGVPPAWHTLASSQGYGTSSTRPHANTAQSFQQVVGGSAATLGRRQATVPSSGASYGTPSAQNMHSHPPTAPDRRATAPSSVGDASTPRYATPGDPNNHSTFPSPIPTTRGNVGKPSARRPTGPTSPE